ncbi:hypothetical protein VTH06DRAFT_8257 [Thermothelomyces fergusii]
MCINIVAVCPWCGAETNEYTLVRLCDEKSREFRFTELSPLENMINFSSQRQARGDPIHDCGAQGRITIRSVFEPAACCRDPLCSFRLPIGQESTTLLEFLGQAAGALSSFPGFTNPWNRSDEDILLCSALHLMNDNFLDTYQLQTHQQQEQPEQQHQDRYQHQQEHRQDQQQQQRQEQASRPPRKPSRAWTAEEIQALYENMNNPEWTYARMSEQDPRLRNRTAHAIESKVYEVRGKRKALREARKAGGGGVTSKQHLKQRNRGGRSGSASCKPPAAEEHLRRREHDDDGDGSHDGGSGAGPGLAGQLLA